MTRWPHLRWLVIVERNTVKRKEHFHFRWQYRSVWWYLSFKFIRGLIWKGLQNVYFSIYFFLLSRKVYKSEFTADRRTRKCAVRCRCSPICWEEEDFDHRNLAEWQVVKFQQSNLWWRVCVIFFPFLDLKHETNFKRNAHAFHWQTIK